MILSYDRVKLEKVGDFYAPTWLIFAGPVTNFTAMVMLKIYERCI